MRKLVLVFMIAVMAGCGDSGPDYVNANVLFLSNKPFGKTVKKLYMNDTLRHVSDLDKGWVKVTVDADTMYFKDSGFPSLIDDTPFNKWKAVDRENGHLKLVHPQGFLTMPDGTMFENGTYFRITSTYNTDSLIECRAVGGSSNKKINPMYLKYDWNKIWNKYPKLKQ